MICGPKLGYNPNASKSWLIVKPQVETKAREIFKGTNISIKTERRNTLVALLEVNMDAVNTPRNCKVKPWYSQLWVLSKIAKREPQVTCAAFVSGFQHKLPYHIRAMPSIKQPLTQLDATVDTIFIPATTDGHICTADEQLLLFLPVKKGDVAIPIFLTVMNFLSSPIPTQLRNNWLNISTAKTAQQ